MTATFAALVCGISCLAGPGSVDDERRVIERRVLTTRPAMTTAPAEYVEVIEAPCPHQCRKCRKVEADVEELDASNPWCTPDLCITYEVEIEDACPGQCFDLVLRVRHHRNVLLEAVVPLDQPTEVDDDQLEFEGGFSGAMGLVVMEDHDALRVEARVVERSSGRTLARETEDVDDDDDDCHVPAEEVIIQEQVIQEEIIQEPIIQEELRDTP